jgi:hypothetical protein
MPGRILFLARFLTQRAQRKTFGNFALLRRRVRKIINHGAECAPASLTIVKNVSQQIRWARNFVLAAARA